MGGGVKRGEAEEAGEGQEGREMVWGPEILGKKVLGKFCGLWALDGAFPRHDGRRGAGWAL